MSGLISDLLTLAGADSHSFTIRAASCEPDTLLLDTFEAFELLAREKGYHLSIQLPEEKTTPVFCDSDRIRQVLSVLLHNAFSFCPSGSRITLSLSQQDKITSISVADNGPGIPDDRKAHLFDRFYRGGFLPPGHRAFRPGAFHCPGNHGCPSWKPHRFRHPWRRLHLYLNPEQLPEKALTQTHQIFRVLFSCRFKGGMHGQLRKADIRRRYGNMCRGYVPQRRTSGNIGTIGKVLAGDILLPADVSYHRRRIGIRGIFLASLEFQHNTAV